MSPPNTVSSTSGQKPQTKTTAQNEAAAARKFQARLVANEGGETASIVIRAGDTLHKIADRAGISIDALLAANTQFDATSVDGIHNWSRKRHGERDADDLRLGERITVPLANPSISQAEVRSTPQPVKVRINEAPPRKAATVKVAEQKPANTGVAEQKAAATGVAESKDITVTVPAKALENGGAVVTKVGDVTVSVKTDGNSGGLSTASKSSEPAPAVQTATTGDGTSVPASKPAEAVQGKAETAAVTPTPVTTTEPAKLEVNGPPAPPSDPEPKIIDKDHNHLVMLTVGGSGAKDPKSADNRIGLNIESLNSSVNPNNGTYQFGMSITSPGRVQEPAKKLDATARMTLFSVGRKPIKTTDENGKEKSVEAVGFKAFGMPGADRFASVSAYANISGMPMGSITQPNGTAVDGKSATSPVHLGLAGSVGSLNAHYAWGLGNGAVRNTATNALELKQTDIYGADIAVPFNFTGKVRLDKLHGGITGRRTITTPENGTPGKATFANSTFVESYFKIDAGKMNSVLPGQEASPKANSVGLFRMRLETPIASKIDPKLTLRYDQPMWEVRNVTRDANGNLKVTSQMRFEAMTAFQLGLSSENRAAVQNFTVGLRAKF